MANETLTAIGVKSFDDIDYYTVRSESENDILKIYHRREKGALFQRSEKFKFHRATKMVPTNEAGKKLKQISEVSPMLTRVMQELDAICKTKRDSKTAKEEILTELRHLEKVVSNKISEIESKLERL